ncbi:protein kinase [Streptomyces sp. OUCMDZ-4982]|uniref:serine/threonine-protein kinase n=1 Tax=Streptomyces sp. OUCMDZ-4982 TaxID=2973090 RepID=UPI00215BFB87|nr:protein kinase [Streptomyces sp. OUCMDZ-4982]MCR8942027.1 protein kinase [Streptomyces sp. OUCMDZ-4982]
MRPGERVGQFTVLAELASGGMGRVYLARSPAGRTVALKTLLADGADDRRRFVREVECARRVRGVYTASVVDADPEARVPWMAQEYVPAPSLKDLVEECGTLGADALHWVGAGMAEAVASLHAAGLVHRDVKPSNVLLPVEGPRLIDFGISQAHDLTRTQSALGTVAYASPEQARGEPTTEASDMFSLGAPLFYLAVGWPPYRDIEHISAMELLVRAATGDIDTSGLPAELDPLVLPCLDPDPRSRPTPAEVIAHCADHLGGSPAARGGGGLLGARWTDAVERHRAERTDALRHAIRRVDASAELPATPERAGPDEPTRPVGSPPATARLAAPTDPGAAPGGSRRWWFVAASAGAALLVAGVLVWQPWGGGGGTGAAGAPDAPVRFLEVESEQPGACPAPGGAADPLAPSRPAVPTGRGFTSDDRDECVVVSTAPGLTVNRFVRVTAFEDGAQEGWAVRVEFQDADAEKFAELTGTVTDRPPPTNALAIVQGENRLLAKVAVIGRITGGDAVIATRLGRNEAASSPTSWGRSRERISHDHGRHRASGGHHEHPVRDDGRHQEPAHGAVRPRQLAALVAARRCRRRWGNRPGKASRGPVLPCGHPGPTRIPALFTNRRKGTGP